MPKETEAYRGEDKTLELIRERAKIIQDKFPDNPENANWNAACHELIKEMNSEGLKTTAEEISNHIISE